MFFASYLLEFQFFFVCRMLKAVTQTVPGALKLNNLPEELCHGPKLND